MSQELFELFGMLGAWVGLTALVHRVVRPILLRLAASAADPMRASRRGRQPGSGVASPAQPLGSASPRRIDSAA